MRRFKNIKFSIFRAMNHTLKIIIFFNYKNIRLFCLLANFFVMTLAEYASAEHFSKFGILRANIAHYCENSKWLVCYDIKPEASLQRSEIVAFDKEGNIFVITGELIPDSTDLLSFESYKNPSIMFSTPDGFLYSWRSLDQEKPFEVFLSIAQYEDHIEKFALYPLLKSSKDGLISFELLESNPNIYDIAIAQPRPDSIWKLESPTASRSRLGMVLSKPNDKGLYMVVRVAEHMAASASGLQENDIITKVSVNGENFTSKIIDDLAEDKSRRIITLNVQRKSDKNKISKLNINIFTPSYLELFLGRPKVTD